ncbi:integrase, catalytic region, zinc finger, CCHC-type containing protein [Tanacetum coccineum]|uniref:Integrase, catalytic region, zinc finger, CCHC-type containing protein n=1 Tax=Tanacetum coccineum TaxID=301880 RepID=A0ABQ5EPB8_9ASTR
MSENEDRYHDTVLDLEAKLKKNVDLILKNLANSLQRICLCLEQSFLYLASSLGNSDISLNVGDTEDTLDDASKSQQKVYQKMNDPVAVVNKQNCWIIDYAQINALYKDFVPQKELSAEKKYFPSSFIHSDKNSNATPSILASMPNNSLHAEIEHLKKKLIEIQEGLQTRIKILEKDVQRFSIQLKKTRSQTQTEMDEFIAHVFEKTYAYGAIRAENQNLLFTKSELKTRLANVEKVVQIILWIVDSGCSKHMTGDRSLLKNFIEKFMGTVRFGNDNFAAITGYGDYIRGGRESNLYTISISDMAASSSVCLMFMATSTKSWLWHCRLSHLNFGTINDLTRLDLVDGLPSYKYGKDHLCSVVKE